MCGLTGVLSAAGGEDSKKAIVQRMTDAILHRGPDAGGIWAEDEVTLGHRRLSILDLSEAGAQPMPSACGRFIIAYNGEIYNHLDIRRELEEAGVGAAWRGHSDTETLLTGIARWGLDATLQRAKGMFALALWDRKSRCLSLARDRMGEKPLYWGWAGRDLVFGSELKALRQHPDCSRGVCETALKHFLRFSYVPAPRSIHPGIYKLEPGSILEVQETPPAEPPSHPLRPGERHGSLSIRRYWSLADTLEQAAPLEDETGILAQLDETLQRAIKRQMISDVPLGAFLSGGVDSSLIVALMQAQSSQPVKTFTIGFENAAYNEAPHAADVARHLGTDHAEMIVTEAETRDVIPRLPDLYDEPFADSSQIPTFLVCKAARQNVTVALSGDAGDELFGGYNRYIWGPRLWRQMERIPAPLRNGVGHMIGAIPTTAWDTIGKFAGKASDRLAVSLPGEKAHKLAGRMRQADSLDAFYRGLISTSDEAHLRTAPDPLLLDDPLPRRFDDDPAGWMMAQDMRTYLPDDILCKVDRAAMGVSLETRVPFLDPDVVAFSARLPLDMKIRDGQGKWALRQVLYQHVPRALIDRPKAGFAIPAGHWLRGPLRDWAEELLSRKRLTDEGFLDPNIIRQTWAEHLAGRRDWTTRLWAVLMFQAWYAEQARP